MIKNRNYISSLYVILFLISIQICLNMSYVKTFSNHLNKLTEKLDNFCLMNDVCYQAFKMDNYCCNFFCCNMIKYITKNE